MSSVVVDFPVSKRHADFLESLPAKFQQSSVRKAAVFATTPLVKATRAAAPKDSGALRESIAKKTKVYKNNGVVISMVGAKRGFTRYYTGKKRVPERYLELILFGHRKRKKSETKLGTDGGRKNRLVKRDGFTGPVDFVRPNNFYARAFRRASPAMGQRFGGKLKKDLLKDLERAKRKGAL